MIYGGWFGWLSILDYSFLSSGLDIDAIIRVIINSRRSHVKKPGVMVACFVLKVAYR
jgi:hypothetical protein